MSNPQLPFGLQADQLKAGAVRNMTSDKLATFSVGGMKKTPFQKHKEALEAKRREQEAQAAAELAKWEEDFDSSAADRPKQFVKGETIQQGQAGGSSSRAPPPARGAPSAAARSMFSAPADDVDGEDIDGAALDGAPLIRPNDSARAPLRISAPVLRKGGAAEAAPAGGAPPGRRKESKPSQMAQFMAELKQEQDVRDMRGERDSARGISNRDEKEMARHSGYDATADADTTNLYVGNLAPSLNEEGLFRVFERFGPIQSVKVMWPRSEEERRLRNHCGFVAFVDRKDAARAKEELNETDPSGVGIPMKIGWGKAVARPTAPLSIGDITARAKLGAQAIIGGGPPPPAPDVAPPRPPGGGPVPPPAPPLRQQWPHPSAAAAAASAGMIPGAAPPLMPQPPGVSGGAWAPAGVTAAQPRMGIPAAGFSPPPLTVVMPTDAARRELIDRLALFVAAEGHTFECAIMEREQVTGRRLHHHYHRRLHHHYHRHLHHHYHRRLHLTSSTSLPLQLNPVYRFLFDQQLPDHLYYRWKVISLCCGRHVTPYLTPHIPHIRR